MRNLKFMVSRAANGYTINAFDGDDFEAKHLGDCHIAATQDEVAKVVKKICHGAFTEGDPKERPSGDKK